MGMTIEEAIKYYENKNVVLTEEEALANTLALNTMRKYQQLQADYENRLRADMVAMLTEIQLEIEEKEQYYQDKFLASKNAVHEAAMGGRMFGCGECKEVIQQKINSLKEA